MAREKVNTYLVKMQGDEWFYPLKVGMVLEPGDIVTVERADKILIQGRVKKISKFELRENEHGEVMYSAIADVCPLLH